MAAWLAGAAAGSLLIVWLFVCLVDPWNALPLSPPAPRVPVSSNARFTMPALARSPRFDSAVVGSSSSRLLRPTVLDPLFGGHFVNLSMNAATAWEQSQILGVFTRAHPAARTVIIGLDTAWCSEAPPKLTPRPFPGWMYGRSAWRGYRTMLTLYAVQEAGNELWTMLGLKRQHYGSDGFTRFVPPESEYDPARVAAAFARFTKPVDLPAGSAPKVLPALPMLAAALRALPAGTRKIVFFTPAEIVMQGQPGSDWAAMLAACKAQVVALARPVPNTTVIDLLRPSPITDHIANYWDPVHYRLPIADRIAADLARGDTPDSRVLLP